MHYAILKIEGRWIIRRNDATAGFVGYADSRGEAVRIARLLAGPRGSVVIIRKARKP